ncbi:MAG: hypothetical protein ABEJ05_05720 [Haloglomus sp.]
MTRHVETTRTRRSLLAAVGAAAAGGLAGCRGDGGDATATATPTEGCSPSAADLSKSVPAPYQGAESKGGLTREPSRLLPKSRGDYQREPNGDQRCSRCSYYIPDKNGDCLGACVRIEGLIDPGGYCEYYRTQVGGGW